MKKRILSAFLVLCMMLTMVPTAALAAEDPGGGNGSDRVHTESNDGIVVDKTVNYDGDGNYSLTLEAYVTNEVTKGSKTTPLDIVLVLDVSGSMAQNTTSYTYEATQETNWSYSDIDSWWADEYYYKVGESYYEVHAVWERKGSFPNRYTEYSLYYSDDNGIRHSLGEPARDEDSTILSNTVLYTRRNDGSTSKLSAMKTAVNSFIDQVAENAAGDTSTTEDNVIHRISIVKFGSDNRDSVGNGHNRSGYNYSQVVKDLTEVSSNVQELKSTVNSLDASGATQVNYGLKHAQRVLSGDQQYGLGGAREEAKQVVVVFTDGQPTSGSSWEGGVAADAVNLACDLKDGGVTVYTIGMFEDADPSDTDGRFNKYMNGVSSNYPNAEVTNWRGDRTQDWDDCKLGGRVTEGNYYFAADDAEELENAFSTIADNVSTSKVAAGANTVLSDTLSEFFTFPEGLTGSSDGGMVQYAEVKGQDADGSYTWYEPETLTGVTPVVNADSKTITVKGFDYTANAVTKTTNQDGTVTWSGGKLVLTFPIQPDVNGSWSAAETYVTNDTDEHKAGLSGYMVDEKPNQSLELTESPEAPVETYQVLYDANADDADGTVTDSKYYITGGEAMVLQNMFTRPGYEFTGWNTEKNGAGTPYAAGSAITIENTNVTLYAQWKSSTASYRVEYYQQNLKDDNYSIVADDTLTPSGTVGDTATAEIKEYEGFTYNENRSNSSGIIAEDGTLVLKLYYDRNEYTVTYEYEGTVPAGAPEVPGEQTYKYGETVELAKMPDVTDYRFSGWYSEDVALSGGSFTMPDHAVVIKGSFSQLNSYTVTYDLNGGTTTSSQTVFPGLAYGDKTPRIEDPTKEPSELYSYEFTGWSPEIADTVTGDITYRAEYTRTEREFTVTYYLDGTLYAEPESYTYGETVVIKKQAEDATEWTTNDLQESDIIEGLFYMPEHNVVFTATTDGTVTPDECTYTVVYHYVDRDGNEETETDPKDEPSTAGTPVSRLYNTDRTSYNGSTYIFDRAELNDVEIIDGETLQAGHNSIDVYYDIDELGPDDEPDGTPDKDQIVFTYVSADGSMGFVNPEKEVVTRDQTGMASPTGAVATAEEGYEFVEWTDDYYHSTDTDAGMESLAGLPYDEDTTFTAYFQKVGEEPVNTISVIFLAENGTFSNGQTAYTAIVEVNADGEYRLAEGDILEATPDTGYGDPSWTCNYEDCDAPKIGDPVEDWDLFVVTFHPAGVVPTQVTVTYAWSGDHPEGVELPETETLAAGRRLHHSAAQ
ncbi:MAG: InlB B-repeat-containing protein [Dysosmobacter sp.]